MPKLLSMNPAKIAFLFATIFAIMSLIVAVVFLSMGYIIEGVGVLLVGIQVPVLAALWFAYRASTRTQRSYQLQKSRSEDVKSLQKQLGDLRGEVASHAEREEIWHDLTRKRIREKHNSLALILRKNRDLHELTRKRIREKNISVHKLIGSRADKIENTQKKMSVDLAQQKSDVDPSSSAPGRDRTAVRNALFTILERSGT